MRGNFTLIDHVLVILITLLLFLEVDIVDRENELSSDSARLKSATFLSTAKIGKTMEALSNI